MIRFKAAVLLAVVVLGALLPGCQSPASAPDNLQQAYEKAFAGAAWAVRVTGGRFIEEWADTKAGVTTLYRRYLLIGEARSMTSKALSFEGVYVSVPFATQREGEAQVWLSGVPDVEALIETWEQRMDQRYVWPDLIRQGHSQRYSAYKLLFLVPLEGYQEYTLYPDLAVMDVLRHTDTAHRDETDYELCVPVYGQNIADLSPVAWPVLASWIDFYVPWRPLVRYDMNLPEPITAKGWVGRQPNLAIGRFTGFVGQEDTGSTRYYLYTFEVERVLAGSFESDTVIVRQQISRKQLWYDIVSYRYKHPEYGRRILIGLRDKHLENSQASHELAEYGGATSIWNFADEQELVARQWPVVESTTSRFVDWYLVSPDRITLSEVEGWLTEKADET